MHGTHSVFDKYTRDKQETTEKYIRWFCGLQQGVRSNKPKLMWQKLKMYSIQGEMFNALQSLYTNVRGSIKLNGLNYRFQLECGLKQGCNLSPTLFNLFVNDLAMDIKSLNTSVKVGEENIGIPLFADDIILLAENEVGLQRNFEVLSHSMVQNLGNGNKRREKQNSLL